MHLVSPRPRPADLPGRRRQDLPRLPGLAEVSGLLGLPTVAAVVEAARGRHHDLWCLRAPGSRRLGTLQPVRPVTTHRAPHRQRCLLLTMRTGFRAALHPVRPPRRCPAVPPGCGAVPPLQRRTSPDLRLLWPDPGPNRSRRWLHSVRHIGVSALLQLRRRNLPDRRRPARLLSVPAPATDSPVLRRSRPRPAASARRLLRRPAERRRSPTKPRLAQPPPCSPARRARHAARPGTDRPCHLGRRHCRPHQTVTVGGAPSPSPCGQRRAAHPRRALPAARADHSAPYRQRRPRPSRSASTLGALACPARSPAQHRGRQAQRGGQRCRPSPRQRGRPVPSLVDQPRHAARPAEPARGRRVDCRTSRVDLQSADHVPPLGGAATPHSRRGSGRPTARHAHRPGCPPTSSSPTLRPDGASPTTPSPPATASRSVWSSSTASP